MTVDLLRIQDLSFAYPGQAALAAAWSGSIGAGVTLLHGDTGSGKSTLLRIMAGVLPAGGRLTLGGVALDAEPEAYRRQVFWCDPATDAFDASTVRECTAALSAGDAGFNEPQWHALVDGFALTEHLHKPLYMLSTGSKRKVWLAAALASGRRLILLDEPTGALDARSIGHLWAAVARVAQQPGRAVVVSSAERLDRLPLAATIELPLR